MKVIFLDRDGTLNVDKGYLGDPAQLELLPQVPEALVSLKNRGYVFIIVTNQGGIARGFYTEEALKSIHERLRAFLAPQGISFQAVYHCPHHIEGVIPELTKPCECRKPGTGMFQQARREFVIDWENSYMVGDKESDVQAGLAMGLKAVFLGESVSSGLRERVQVVSSLWEFSQTLG